MLSPEYLSSKYCQHEMDRAILRDPSFEQGVVIPVVQAECPLPEAITTPEPVYVDLIDDRRPEPWSLLLAKCDADLGTHAPHWLKARDDIRRYLTRGESVNLTVQGRVQWKPLIDDLRREHSLADLREVDLRNPETYARKAIVESILAACGILGPVPDKPNDGRTRACLEAPPCPGPPRPDPLRSRHPPRRLRDRSVLGIAVPDDRIEETGPADPVTTAIPDFAPERTSSLVDHGPQDRRTQGEAMTPRPLGEICLRPGDHLSAPLVAGVALSPADIVP